MDLVRVICPAKVNLVLEVLGRRPDGYHNLESVILPVSLWDELLLSKGVAYSGSSVFLEVRGEVEGVPLGEANLAWKAAYYFQQVLNLQEGVEILLEKHIPLQAGLGGGSSDAGGVLRGLNLLWKAGYSREALARIGAQIGSDVPFFIYSEPALVLGRGEIVQPLGPVPSLSMVIIKPPVGISTAWAYHQLELGETQRKGQRANLMVQALREGSWEEIAHLLYNDLEAPVLSAYPEVKRARRYLLEQGCSGALMSGSGSAVFGLTRDREMAERIARGVPAEIGRAWAVRTINLDEEEGFV